MSTSQFYYYKNRGQTLGPFDLSQIQQRAKRAQISNRSEISTDGFSWQPAQNFPEIFAGNTTAPPTAATPTAAPEIAVIEEASEWHYMLNGEQQGPVTKSQLQQMIGLGNLKPTDFVWKDGMIDWLEIQNVPDLATQQPMVQQPMMQQPMMQQNAAGVGQQVFCTNCGASIPQQAAVCVHCGVPNKATSVASNAFPMEPLAPGELRWYQWLPNAVKTKYADFKGRARRKEYWFFQLHSLLLIYGGTFALAFFEGFVTEGECFSGNGDPVLAGLWLIVVSLGLIIPNLAVNVRRLHDVNKSGWWILISLVPFGALVLLVFYCQEGDSGPNQYGPNPKL